MANFEESNTFLHQQKESGESDDKKSSTAPASSEKKASADTVTAPSPPASVPMGWTADGLPVGHSVMGEPVMRRAEWDTGLCACFGRNDEFCSGDLEVCVVGSVAPCVLYGSNVERIGSAPGTFPNHCLRYTGLYLIGNLCFGWNCLAPWFSFQSRTAIRRKFNLEGGYEGLVRSFGCSSGAFTEDEKKREQCESACDLVTHVFCHVCALCQEAREVRHRLPPPGFKAQPIVVMLPPEEQTMGR